MKMQKKEEMALTSGQSKVKGDWPGLISDGDPVSERFLVKYDQASDDGCDTYEENLLEKTPIRWYFEEAWLKTLKKNFFTRSKRPLG